MSPAHGEADGNGVHLPLAVGAAALLPVAALSPQGVTVLGALVSAWALVPLVRSRAWTRLARWPPTWMLALLFLWCMLSAFWSIVPQQSLRLLVPLFFLILGTLVYLLAGGEVGPAGARRVGRWWFAGFAAAAALIAFDILMEFPIAGFAGDLGDLDTHPGAYVKVYDQAIGLVLISAWPLTLVLTGRLLRWVPVAAAAVLVLSALNLSAKIGLVLGIAAYAWCRWMPRAATVATVAACVVLVLAAPWVFSWIDPEGPVGLALADVKLSGQHRLYIWNFVAERIGERPWLGWGLDSSASIPGGDVKILLDSPFLPLHPHNIGLQLWLELGPAGAFAGAAVLVLAGRGLLALEPEQRPAGLALLVTIFTAASLSYGVWQNWWWAAQAITVALASTQLGRRRAAPQPGAA